MTAAAMQVTSTTQVSQPTRRPRIRHGFLAAALLVVAALRAASGDWPWAGILGAAAVTEGVLWVLERRSRTRDAAAAGADRPEPDAELLARSLHAHRQAQRLWGCVLAVALAGGLVLMASSPTMAAGVAVVGLVSLARFRRERRTVETLNRVVS